VSHALSPQGRCSRKISPFQSRQTSSTQGWAISYIERNPSDYVPFRDSILTPLPAVYWTHLCHTSALKGLILDSCYARLSSRSQRYSRVPWLRSSHSSQYLTMSSMFTSLQPGTEARHPPIVNESFSQLYPQAANLRLQTLSKTSPTSSMTVPWWTAHQTHLQVFPRSTLHPANSPRPA
jgi:hypothetical protein